MALYETANSSLGFADPTDPTDRYARDYDSWNKQHSSDENRWLLRFTSRFAGQVRRMSFFVVAVASVSSGLQLQISCAKTAGDEITAPSGDTTLTSNAGTLTSGASSGTNESSNCNNTVDNSSTTAAANTSPLPDKDFSVVDVKTYGAVGDGITNDTAAFNKALASLATSGGTCRVPTGMYLISASGISSHVKSGVHLVGMGRGASVLKIAAMPTGALVWGDGDNWSVENLTLDMQDYSPLRNYSAIACKGNNWRVAKCSIVKIGRIGIGVAGGDNWSIEGNYIAKTTPAQTLNQSILVTKYGDKGATNARIIDNICDGSGITFWGLHSIIAHNKVSNAGFGAGIATGQVANCHSIQVIGNTCTGGRGLDENRTWVSGFELWGSDSVIANNTAYNNASSGIIVGGQNCVVIANRSYNNGVQNGGYGFSARYQTSTINASGSIFIANWANDTRYPGRGMTQTYGYGEPVGGLRGIMHIRNDYNGNKIGAATSNGDQRNVSTAQASRAITMRISPGMKTKLDALAESAELPENARRALGQCLAR